MNRFLALSLIFLLGLPLPTYATDQEDEDSVRRTAENRQVEEKLSAMSPEEKSLHAAKMLLAKFVKDETTESLENFNKLTAGFNEQIRDRIDSQLIHESEKLLEEWLPEDVTALEMGTFLTNEYRIKQIVLFCANLKPLPNGQQTETRNKILGLCELYKMWRNEGDQEVAHAIKKIYAQYNQEETFTPIWTAYWDLDLIDKTIFNTTYTISLLRTNPYLKYGSLTAMAGIATWWIVKRRLPILPNIL